jgi:hypothetical protein
MKQRNNLNKEWNANSWKQKIKCPTREDEGERKKKGEMYWKTESRLNN